MEASLTLRPFTLSDVPAILTIQAAALAASQWTAFDYQQVFSEAPPAVRAWLAELESHPIGFLVSRLAADEVEILNLAVAPAHRRLGCGSRLLSAALDAARKDGARQIFLEVRESNSAAIAFYHRHGFSLLGRRSRYYSDPAEDALVLVRQSL